MTEKPAIKFEKIYNGNTLGTLNDIYATDSTGTKWLVAELNDDLGIYTGFDTVAAFQHRLIASYNALSGRDPAKLEGLTRAVGRLSMSVCGNINDDFARVPWNAIHELNASLAAFEKGEE